MFRKLAGFFETQCMYERGNST